MPTKENIFLETQPSYTIKHIKSMIHEKIGVPTDELKLEFAGCLLEDGRTLNDYNIQDGDTVIMNYNTGIVTVIIMLTIEDSFTFVPLSQVIC
jgi:hypothetical protein